MRKTLVETSHPMVRINVTPIIDVALVLVIVLLITGPILSIADLGVNLPAARTRGAEDEDRITVTLGRSGELAVDDEVVSRATVANAVAQRLAETESGEVLVIVRADSSAPHRSVRDLLRTLRGAGAARLAIGTRQAGSDER
jgi:biopolymer transport protein ExbD